MSTFRKVCGIISIICYAIATYLLWDIAWTEFAGVFAVVIGIVCAHISNDKEC